MQQEPILSNFSSSSSSSSNVHTMTLSNINVSIANALRRTILTDIDTYVFYTENYTDNKCKIIKNTSRLHNEIIKHRLSCIPIHYKLPSSADEGSNQEYLNLVDDYILEVDVENNTDSIIYITTKDFKIKNITTGEYLSSDITKKIFPPNIITQHYIDFVRLRPKMGDSILGEQLKLNCNFSISNCSVSSMFNVVSKCAYQFTPDITKQSLEWDKIEKKLIKDKVVVEDIEFQKKNFYLLDAERIYIPDSFDFTIETIGVYENVEIIKKACVVLITKIISLIKEIDSNTIEIIKSVNSSENSFDIILDEPIGDYSIGKVLEYYLYIEYFIKDKLLSFCGFKKMHPHDTFITLRVEFMDETEKTTVKQCLRNACIFSQDIFKKINSKF